MKIVYKKVDELIPYENNPRYNDDAVKYVANSIKEFGFKVPMVIDKNNVIVAGHTRYKASQELGIKEVPCIIADDLTEDQVNAFRLVDNKVSEQAYWNYDLLDEELDLINMNLEEFGFSKLDDLDLTQFIEDMPDKTKTEEDKKTVVCPECGKEFEI